MASSAYADQSIRRRRQHQRLFAKLRVSAAPELRRLVTTSGGRIQFQFVDQPKDADIECYWIADAHNLVNSAESGETRLSKNRDGLIHVTMQLLTAPSLSELPMTENRIRRITLHEIGHALGLTGHTTDPHDAMFCRLPWKINGKI